MAESAEKTSIGAVVSTSHTGDFEAPLSHLTQATGFVETMHPASFRDAVDLRVGDMLLHGEVAFVCDAPMGWLIRFDPTPELELLVGREKLGESGDVARFDGDDNDESDPGMWGEPTPTFQGPPLVNPKDALADLLADLDETQAR